MRRISHKIKESFEAVTPDALHQILADCEKVKTEVIPLPVKRKPHVVLRVLASAAVLALLVGVGALAGGLFTRPSQPEPNITQAQPQASSPSDQEILAAFCETVGKKYDDIKNIVTIRHYWQYEGLYFFYVDGLYSYSNEINAKTMENMEFIFATDQRLYLYKDGVCADFHIREQSHKLLTYNALEAFYQYHTSQNPQLYDPSQWPAKTELDCPAHLTVEKRAELEAALGFDQFDTDSLWYNKNDSTGVRYYGTYEGYDILFQKGELQVENIQTIAQQAFAHNCSFALYAHKDGQLLNLSDVYDGGLISKASIAAAREYHNQCYKLEMVATCRPHVIMRYQEETIESVWNQISDEPFGTWYSEETPDGNWRVYAGDILFYDGGQQEDEFTTITIGNYSFSHIKTFKLYILAPGPLTLIDLSENPDAIINESDLKEAYEQHMQVQNTLLGEDWMENSEPECTEHVYNSRLLVEPTCQQFGTKEYFCINCEYSYTEQVPKTDHDWGISTCNYISRCKTCDAVIDPAHQGAMLRGYSEPTANSAGKRSYYCPRCGQYFTTPYGQTGDYMLQAIQYKAGKYAESLGFEYCENYPMSPDFEYEYTELYSVIESMGGQNALEQKAYELIDELYADAQSVSVSAGACKLWFTIEYLVDQGNNIGVFRIYTYIAY